MSLIETHIGFLEFAQKEYQNALAEQSGNGVEFWLQQMHCLCQQLYWLQNSCGSPVAIGVPPKGYSLNSLQKLGEPFSMSNVVLPTTPLSRKPTPTEYAWNDGFEGVTLDNS